MQETLDLRVTPRVAAEPHLLSQEVARLAGVSKESVSHVLVTRRSIDARQRQVMVNLSVRAWVRTGDYWTVYFDVIERIYAELPQSGVSFPYPQMDVHIVRAN